MLHFPHQASCLSHGFCVVVRQRDAAHQSAPFFAIFGAHHPGARQPPNSSQMTVQPSFLGPASAQPFKTDKPNIYLITLEIENYSLTTKKKNCARIPVPFTLMFTVAAMLAGAHAVRETHGQI